MNKRKRGLATTAVIILLLIVTIFRSHWVPSPAVQATSSLAGLPQTNSAGFERANGPRTFSFPADDGAHPDFQTEWWYYTGNLTTDSGRHFGFELTFFRRGLIPLSQQSPRESDWAANQVYMGHFALTDVGASQFYAFERLERGAAGLAGARSVPAYQVWIDDWEVSATGSNSYQLKASEDGKSITLHLVDTQGPILEGDQGYSQKGSESGNASYYYSRTRLDTDGTMSIDGQTYAVKGASWMDHEFSTTALSAQTAGWDWFALQMDDGTCLMLYQIRSYQGSVLWSNGTWITASGASHSLVTSDFSIGVNSTWKSPHSQAVYPSSWTIQIPSEQLTLNIVPYLPDQELNLSFTYWEGAVRLSGSRAGQIISGQGYIELTGYASPMNGQF
jgi:predicted secreted hydrolase